MDMAEEGEDVRTSETVHIAILRSRQLRGVKGDAITSLVHVEFDNKSLGDSSRVESTAESEAEYNFSSSFECSFTEPGHTIEDVASKPVIVTVSEVLPKEKKQKDEKTAAIGQCTIDLLPLVLGKTRVECTLQVHPVAGSPMEGLSADMPKAEIDVAISVNDTLLDANSLMSSNLLTVRIGSAYSLPDSWSLLGVQHNYSIGLPVPTSGEKEEPLIFSHGTLKPGAEKEFQQKPLKWFSQPHISHGAHHIPDIYFEKLPPEEEKGDLKSKDGAEFRRECENEKNRVTWDVEKRCFLEPNARAILQNKIAETRLWPVEIMRLPPPPQAKAAGGNKKDAKPEKEEERQISYHGICYVDFGPLLYPGVKRVAGAFLVHPYNDHDLNVKTKRKHAIANEALRVSSGMSRVTGSSPIQKGGKGGGPASVSKDAPSKKGSALLKTADSGSEVESTQHQNIEGEMYLESRTFVYMEFILHQPLVPRREPEQLAKLVSEYIPPRPPMKRAVGGAQKAVDDFHGQVAGISTLVMSEFRDMFGDEMADPDAPSNPNKDEIRKKQLLFKLNTSGKYFAFKEQLKHSVVKIVREKYLRTTAFQDKNKMEEFLEELYVYLIDEMHKCLHKVLVNENDEEKSFESYASSEQLKRFAQEAEVNGDYEAAANYYQERLTKDKNDPEHWFDYGTFNLLRGDYPKATECFRESISINQTFLKGLLMFGILSAMQGKRDEAEAVFERATTISGTLPQCLSWTILALFYESLGNEIRAEHAFAEARQLNVQSLSTEHEPSEEEIENIISKAEIEGDPSSLLSPSTGITRNVTGSMKSGSTSKGSKAVGRKSQKSDPIPIKTESPRPRLKSIFLQGAEWLLDMKSLKFAGIALSKELLDPMGGPTADYYVALARLHMMKEKYDSAEADLKQATQIDHQHPDAWAITGHLQYVRGEKSAACDCYERTLAFVTDASEMHSIYLRLGSIYISQEEYQKAKETFLLACKYSPSCISWLGVGIACYRLGELTEAEDALGEANLLNNQNPEVWAYLSLVCLRTERKLEAEQSYKYAINLNLTDDNLIQELNTLQKNVSFGNPSF